MSTTADPKFGSEFERRFHFRNPSMPGNHDAHSRIPENLRPYHVRTLVPQLRKRRVGFVFAGRSLKRPEIRARRQSCCDKYLHLSPASIEIHGAGFLESPPVRYGNVPRRFQQLMRSRFLIALRSIFPNVVNGISLINSMIWGTLYQERCFLVCS